MTLKERILSRHKLTTAIAGGAVAIVLASGGYVIAHSSPTASANAPAVGKVVPFQPGQPTPATPVGQVPPSFVAGTGTIITGAAADKAKAAALAAYPGGTVNRVVLLSDGEYNVHMIGVNWPHHVFVNTTFRVVGAL